MHIIRPTWWSSPSIKRKTDCALECGSEAESHPERFSLACQTPERLARYVLTWNMVSASARLVGFLSEMPSNLGNWCAIPSNLECLGLDWLHSDEHEPTRRYKALLVFINKMWRDAHSSRKEMREILQWFRVEFFQLLDLNVAGSTSVVPRLRSVHSSGTSWATCRHRSETQEGTEVRTSTTAFSPNAWYVATNVTYTIRNPEYYANSMTHLEMQTHMLVTDRSSWLSWIGTHHMVASLETEALSPLPKLSTLYSQSQRSSKRRTGLRCHDLPLRHALLLLLLWATP